MTCIKKLFTTRPQNSLEFLRRSFIFACIFGLFFGSSSASAFSFGSNVYVPVAQFEVDWQYVHGVQTAVHSTWNGETYQNSPAPSTVSGAYYPIYQVLQLDQYMLPTKTLFTFSTRYISRIPDNSTDFLKITGITPDSDWTLLNRDCNVMNNPNGVAAEYQCTYWGITEQATNAVGWRSRDYFPYLGNNSAPTIQTLGYLNGVRIVTESGSDSSGLTDDDKTYLSGLISQLQASGNTNTQAILSALQSVNSGQTTLNTSIQNLRSDVQAQTEQQHDDYENEVQREEDKQDELEDQSEDVSISANAVANPFANLFNSANCASFPTLASWLNVDPSKIQVCSPYPQQFRPIIEFVSSALVVGLLIRVYYKQLKGGYAS